MRCRFLPVTAPSQPARAFLIVAVTFSMLPIARLAHADGVAMPTEAQWRANRERSLISEPAQKAVIFFRNGQEDLIISPSFAGAPDAFTWVVPVPTRPKVSVLEGAPFHELARLIEPYPLSRRAATGGAALAAEAPKVTVLEREIVGDYDITVLSANDSHALVKWLNTNRYHLPEKAVRPVQEYIHEKWTFVACRIKDASSGKGLSTGTVTPLRLRFAAPQPIYPMRLSSANPAPFHVLIYLLLPDWQAGGVSRLTMLRAPALFAGTPYRVATLQEGQKEYPTLAKLSHDSLQVFDQMAVIQPEGCTVDFVWGVRQAASSGPSVNPRRFRITGEK